MADTLGSYNVFYERIGPAEVTRMTWARFFDSYEPVNTLVAERGRDFIALLEVLGRLYGSKPGLRIKSVVIVLDNGQNHVSKATRKALAARAHWLTVEWLPKYAPELNDIAGGWRDLKVHHPAHQTFADADTLDMVIHDAVTALNSERSRHPHPIGTS